MKRHKPVLLNEAVEFLNCRNGGFYVDCTLGMGGHAQEILKVSSPGGTLMGLDRDEEAIRLSTAVLEPYKDRVQIVRDDFRNLKDQLARNQAPRPDGILADLGPSMLQFSSPDRGFSFQHAGPLDMRMDRRQIQTAESILQKSSERQIQNILKEFGEEPAAGRIAKKIVEERRKKPIQTTDQLRAIVESVKGRKPGEKIHPATQTFQALRIAVNSELNGLDQFVFDAFDSLNEHGRLVFITFHSLEDRIIKQAFQYVSAACRCPKRLMECRCGGKPLSILLTRKPAVATSDEVQDNPSARSAKLRSVEKLSGPVPRQFWAEWIGERQ